MKIIAIIEARMSSSRLPGKVLLPLFNKPILQIIIERIRYSRYSDEIIVATTTNETDIQIENLCGCLGINCYRGSENDVLSRVLNAAEIYQGDLICELTADNPLIDPVIIDQVITSHLSGTYDYTSNILNQRTFPLGLDVRVFPASVLKKVSQMTSNPIDRVHVSCFIYNNPQLFRLNVVTANSEIFAPDIRITLDTSEDYELIKLIYKALYRENEVFLAKEIVKFLKDNPGLLEINKHVRQKTIEEG